MKTLKTILISLAFTLTAQAQELQTTVEKVKPAAPPAWSANLTTYAYDFQGTRDSKKADYGFDATTLNMQLLTLQYQYSPKLTFQLMAQYLENHVETRFQSMWVKDNTRGFGDVVLSAVTPFYASAGGIVLGDVGVSLPTGKIDNKNLSNPNPNVNYPYNMQMGSGTLDTIVGLTALSFQGPVQLGTHLTGVYRSRQENNLGYRLGDMYRADAWADYNTSFGLTPRVVGYYRHKEAVVGEDPTVARDATAGFMEFYYHPQANWDVSAALKYTYKLGALALVAEAGVPVAQDAINYDDVVVATRYYGSLGVSGSF
jgi:hypothetical protein